MSEPTCNIPIDFDEIDDESEDLSTDFEEIDLEDEK